MNDTPHDHSEHPTSQALTRPRKRPSRPLSIALGLAAALLLAFLVWLAPALPLLTHLVGWPIPPSQPFNILVAGTTPVYSGYHQRAAQSFPTGPTDTLFVVHVDPRARLLTIFSVPRDTEVQLGSYGIQKINAAYPDGGPSLMVQAVSSLLGIPIRGYLLVDLSGVRRVVRAMGGVTVYVPAPMHYTDKAGHLNIQLSQGWHHLGGRQAEEFLRFRHDSLGDIGRVMRAENFLSAVEAQLRHPATWLRLPQVLRAAAPHIRTDLGRSTFGALLGFLAFRHPMRATLLEPGSYCSLGGASYWCPDQVAIEQLVGRYLLRSPKLQPTPISQMAQDVIDVVNDGASAAAAQAVADRLIALGLSNVYVFSNSSADPANTSPTTTRIVSDGHYGAALTIQKALGFGKAQIAGTGILGSDVTIHLGSDALAHLPGG